MAQYTEQVRAAVIKMLVELGIDVTIREWKYIRGYPTYIVTNYGEIISLPRKIKIGWSYRTIAAKVLLGGKSGKGYCQVYLGRKSRSTVHQIVAKHFVRGYKKGLEVNHKDGVKSNNRASNLEWVTQDKNREHALKTGLFNFKGEKNPMAKLTNNEVIAIKKLIGNGMTNKTIADRFNVSRPTISLIRSGRTWRSVNV